MRSCGIDSVVHEVWEAGSKDNTIIGYWAEDGSSYEIIVPEQLRTTILRMQNKLAGHYKHIMETERKIREAERTFDIFRQE